MSELGDGIVEHLFCEMVCMAGIEDLMVKYKEVQCETDADGAFGNGYIRSDFVSFQRLASVSLTLVAGSKLSKVLVIYPGNKDG